MAIAIHRQRLAHERRENDLRNVREILARANRAQYDWVDALRILQRRSQPDDTLIAALQDLRRARSSFFTEVLNLRFLLDNDHDLVDASLQLDDTMGAMTSRSGEAVVTRDALPPPVDVKTIEPAMSRWFEMAHATARTNL